MKVKDKTISWRVGPETRAQLTDPMIGDASIKWVPFLMMKNKGDKVLWK